MQKQCDEPGMVKKCLQIQHIQDSEQDNDWAIQYVSVYKILQDE